MLHAVGLGVIIFMLISLSSCAYPNLHFVPATLVFENKAIPRGIEEAPLFQLGQLMDSEWNKQVTYGHNFMIPSVSVFEYRTVQFFSSDSLGIIELRITYAPDRVDPERIVQDYEYFLDQPADWEDNPAPFFRDRFSRSLHQMANVASWVDEHTILQVLFENVGSHVVIRIIDRAWNDERVRLMKEYTGPQPRVYK